jgi:hypothetical protein
MRVARGPCQFFFEFFSTFFPVRIGCAGLTRDAARRKILAPEHSDAGNKTLPAIHFHDCTRRHRVVLRMRAR